MLFILVMVSSNELLIDQDSSNCFSFLQILIVFYSRSIINIYSYEFNVGSHNLSIT